MQNRRIEPWMYRVSGEYISLFIVILFVLFLTFVFSQLNLYWVLGILLLGIIYVRLQQAQYLGNSIRVYGSQFSEIYTLFHGLQNHLGIE